MKEDVFFRCVEGSTEAIMISDLKGFLTYVNPAWERIYGYSKVEALGQTPRLLRSKYHDSVFYTEMWKQIRDPSRGFWKGELINQAKDGREVPVILTISPIRDGDSIYGYMGIANDISEKKQMEAKIFQQDRLATVGLLASGLAHEIGTPLGVVRGRAELILQKKELEAGVRRNLDIIIQQIDRVSKFISSLLNLSRDRETSKGCCVLKDVIDESLLLLNPKLKTIHADAAISVPSDLVAGIECGPLEQVLLNLFMNSIHSMTDANKAGRTEGHHLRISSEVTDTSVRLFVSDTGMGINAKTKANLFRPFYTTKAQGEGTGLGLSISSQLLADCGGSLELYDTQEGQGSTFLIELPLGQ